MGFICTFLIAFLLIFVSELGDKTQLIVLSFSNKLKSSSILIGVAIGTLFSHGVAILFGSHLGLISDSFRFYLAFFTYSSFIVFGVWGFLHRKPLISSLDSGSASSNFNNSFLCHGLPFVFLIAVSIFIGELGDKTFLASLGLGIQYPSFRGSLVLGAILGMVTSNALAIWFGKFLDNKFNPSFIQFLSNLLFIILGVVGFLNIYH